MGLFMTIAKMASSKIVNKVDTNLAEKENINQSEGYCKYINANFVQISESNTKLENETIALIKQIREKKGVKLKFKERCEVSKAKNKIILNLEYLYLTRDFFLILSKSESGLTLKKDELLFLRKFVPYFDGVAVLEVPDEDIDDSFFGIFKEFGQELKETFISSKNPKHLDFREYLSHRRYFGEIDQYILPDVNGAIQKFKNLMESKGGYITHAATNNSETSIEFEECPHCHAKITLNAKFCSECGHKIELKKSISCVKCGKIIDPDSKFCPNCGHKIA